MMTRKAMINICCVATTPSKYPPPPPLTLTPRQSLESAAIYGVIESAADIIERWNTETNTFAKVTSMFYENKQEAMVFIERVKDLQKTMDVLVSEDPNSERLLRAHKLMQIAMKRLQKEFYQILSMNRAYLDPESVSTRSSLTSARSSYSDFPEDIEDLDTIIELEEVSSNVMTDLRSIAECMIGSGYAKECLSIYKSIRKSIIDEGIYRLEVEKTSTGKVKKMSWEVMELKIRSWLKAVKVSMETLFKGEKILCDHVFESSDAIRESCFSDISRDGALLLFGFPEIIATKTCKKNSPPEKVFRLLDMYTAIAGNWQAIESIFSFDSISVVRSLALKSLISLSESIRSLLVEFESGIQKDSSKVVVPGGGVHPLTISVMDHLSLLADYSNVLVDILAGSPPPDRSLLPESYFNVSESDDSPSSELTIRFAWLILVLLCKIDRKSIHYKDFSVQYLFLTNNLQHVVSRARSSNLKNLLGEDWITRHFAKMRQFAGSYKRLAWGPVVATLPENRTVEMTPEEVKERFEKFSESFENAYAKHSVCVVADPNLRDEIRVSIARKLVPIYREFYNTRGSVILAGAGGARNLSSVVRFTPEDIENYLSDLFTEKGSSGNSSASSPSSCRSGQSMS
ncbi:Exocyst complex component Exo70 [Arabidopsis thaliana x Arabidopsis arenosa]|uniref:Exocyst subunit Exo70 family protein n=1 Tax=Arabidopsis thaliana x Arabidopsis arenosa TaxID=1240361 RepID=A0A8T2ARK1_9BRAS|nr:Exocyst complex component Exo70 [Arabidopsis thaliana x Arabidopsis arenosa]